MLHSWMWLVRNIIRHEHVEIMVAHDNEERCGEKHLPIATRSQRIYCVCWMSHSSVYIVRSIANHKYLPGRVQLPLLAPVVPHPATMDFLLVTRKTVKTYGVVREHLIHVKEQVNRHLNRCCGRALKSCDISENVNEKNKVWRAAPVYTNTSTA